MDVSETGLPQNSPLHQNEAALELARSRAELATAVDALHHSECLRSDTAERESVLENELQHRVRNMLATVRTVFTRTVDTARTLEEAADHFIGASIRSRDIKASWRATRKAPSISRCSSATNS